MIIGRFILRLILVPLAWCVAVTVGAITIIVANWSGFAAVANAGAEQQQNYFVMLFLFAPFLLIALGFATLLIMGLASIGALFSEVFAIRSWIFHAANGGLSAALGWAMLSSGGEDVRLVGDLRIMIAAGLVGGLCYWLIAGWSAGFWKPVFTHELPPPNRSPA